jgi:hypothetical protein
MAGARSMQKLSGNKLPGDLQGQQSPRRHEWTIAKNSQVGASSPIQLQARAGLSRVAAARSHRIKT